MRRLLLSLLLAGVAVTPAFADPGDDPDREAARAERQQMRAERAAERQEVRTERSVQAERPRLNVQGHGDTNGGEQAVVRSQRLQQNAGQQAQVDTVQPETLRAARTQRIVTGDNQDNVRTGRQDLRRNRVQNEDFRQSDRPVPNVMRNRVPIVSNTPREGTQPPLRVERRSNPETRWSSNWRHDHRYDWRRWRDRNHSRFHLGFYYDPFGWGYQPYSIGWRLWPSYYSNRYWLNDPWQYRLPYAPAGYRWIRYWDDAILVDTWTGEVVDVIHNFFW